MTRSSAPASLLLVLVIAIALLACGSSQRQLTSMSITPATANAQSYPNGQVQFSATGQYSKAPTTAAVQPAQWGVYLPNGSQGAPTLNSDGLAKCGSLAGTYAITAQAIADPSIPNTTANLIHAKKSVVGTAQLTCP